MTLLDIWLYLTRTPITHLLWIAFCVWVVAAILGLILIWLEAN